MFGKRKDQGEVMAQYRAEESVLKKVERILENVFQGFENGTTFQIHTFEWAKKELIDVRKRLAVLENKFINHQMGKDQ